MIIPRHYEGREQTLIKHILLKQYLERLFMIIGQHQKQICYVDCFSGPWKEEADDLGDTSIAISLGIMKKCRDALASRRKYVEFRALFVEKDKDAYAKLESILRRKEWSSIKTKPLNGDFYELRTSILDWCDDESFVFFFIDPHGWREVVEIPTLQPLLNRPKSEYLINFMFDYILRSHTQQQFEERMKEIFGEVPDTSSMTPEAREAHLIRLYRSRLASSSTRDGGKPQTAHVRVLYTHKDRTFYELVYLTRNPLGIVKFMEEAEKLDPVQKRVRAEAKQKRRITNTGQTEMFDDSALMFDNKSVDLSEVKAYWLGKLKYTPQPYGTVQLADMLEETDWFISQLQSAFRELEKECRVKNLDSTRMRPKHAVHFDANGSLGERLVKLEQ